MPYFDSPELYEHLSPYIPSIDLILRSIHTILDLANSNKPNPLPLGQAIARQKLEADGKGLEELITHLVTPNSRVASMYEGCMFLRELSMIKNAIAILLSGFGEMGTQGFHFKTDDVVRYTRKQIEGMLDFLDKERMDIG